MLSWLSNEGGKRVSELPPGSLDGGKRLLLELQEKHEDTLGELHAGVGDTGGFLLLLAQEVSELADRVSILEDELRYMREKE